MYKRLYELLLTSKFDKKKKYCYITYIWPTIIGFVSVLIKCCKLGWNLKKTGLTTIVHIAGFHNNLIRLKFCPNYFEHFFTFFFYQECLNQNSIVCNLNWIYITICWFWYTKTVKHFNIWSAKSLIMKSNQKQVKCKGAVWKFK